MRHSRKLSTLLLLVMLMTACGSKLDRVITAFEIGAPRVIARFEASNKINQEEGKKLRAAFESLVAGLREYKADPTTPKWEIAVKRLDDLEAKGVFRLSNSEAQVWIDDILAVSRILLGLPSAESRVADDIPKAIRKQPNKLSDEDVKRLEALVK